MVKDRDLRGIGSLFIALGIICVILGLIWENSLFNQYSHVFYVVVGCGAFLLILSYSANTLIRRIGLFTTGVIMCFLFLLRDNESSTSNTLSLLSFAASVFGVIFFSSTKKGKSDESRIILKLRALLLGSITCAIGILAMLTGNQIFWWFGLGLILGGIGAIILGIIVPAELDFEL